MGLDGIESRTSGLRIVFFGTYDSYRPRFKILSGGLRHSGHRVIECHHSIWGRMEDRGRITATIRFILPFFKWLLILPVLIVRYLRLPRHDILIVPYLGQIDMIPARILASLRGVPLVFDPFISLYQTVIVDRKRYSDRHVAGTLCRWLDRIAFRFADHVFCDTVAHADLFRRQLGTSLDSVSIIPVGAESQLFKYSMKPTPESNVKVLFYGWMIPLHGVATIIEAAASLKDTSTIEFTIIGTGQQYPQMRTLAHQLEIDDTIQWVESVAYEDLPRWIDNADICLGIFGTSQKADAVVPNKVFQALSARKPVVTADTTAMREWFTDGTDCILIPPGDAHALNRAIVKLAKNINLRHTIAKNGYELFHNMFAPDKIGRMASNALQHVAHEHRK